MREINRQLGDHDDYNPVSLFRNYSEEELTEEYNRMRRNLNRNINRIEKSGEFEDAQVISAREDFAPASRYSKQELAMKLSELENVLSANTSTLTGLREQRAKVIDTLKDRGYDSVNKANFRDFVKFMESTRTLALSLLRYRYTRAGVPTGEDRNVRLELFSAAQSKGISINSITKDFKFYLNHLDEIKKLPDRPKGRKLGIKSIKKMLKIK